ncbi:unnamed protein product [Oncorhynchus mykiss]|uniref:C3H1-type domain-containing protein n=1 Tax=Oncorhynchus mykiss TaxID=8022 RepID=A0A060WQS8_ONCMY|nr:unnamed protein product [Oncorhynchus mykiss]
MTMDLCMFFHSHGNKEVFSCHGIQLAVDWFLERGHRDITVFVPAWRKEQSRPDTLITDQEILRHLEKDKILVFTPSRRVQGRRVVCYDDRFIVKLAYESDGIIVSNDNYRDLANEKPEWKKFIDERLLMYTFVNDKFMPPDDPLGRHGPSLENFLRKRPVIPEHRKQQCPYGKKCTYGHKCKFFHPERGSQPQRAVADELHPHQAPPKRQSDPSLCAPSYNDLLEERLGRRTKTEARRGSSSSSSSSSSSLLASAPGGPPSSHGFSLQDWGNTSSRAPGLSGLGHSKSYSTCESPELSYHSLMGAYSSLSLVVPRSPDRLFPADLRTGSMVSDCSSEGSTPSPLIRCWMTASSATIPTPITTTITALAATHITPTTHPLSSLEDPPSSLHHFKAQLSYLPPHIQQPSVGSHSGCSGNYPPQPLSQTSSPHSHSHSSPLGHNLGGSTWQDNNSLYKQSPVHPRRIYPGPGQEQRLARWDPHYKHLPQACYEPFTFQGTHSPHPQSLSSSHLPPLTHHSTAPQHQEPPALGRYQDVRENVFVNLCNIFPPELVRVVMVRNPHVMDAQQLAAAILAEKSQAGY